MKKTKPLIHNCMIAIFPKRGDGAIGFVIPKITPVPLSVQQIETLATREKRDRKFSERLMAVAAHKRKLEEWKEKKRKKPSLEETADECKTSKKALSQWLNAFDWAGPEGLKDKTINLTLKMKEFGVPAHAAIVKPLIWECLDQRIKEVEYDMNDDESLCPDCRAICTSHSRALRNARRFTFGSFETTTAEKNGDFDLNKRVPESLDVTFLFLSPEEVDRWNKEVRRMPKKS